MALIGRKIVQSRKYIDPSVKEPKLNYEETFPITVFDAIKLDMEHAGENDKTLADVIEEIRSELFQKQRVFPAKSANYLMTYAGVPGGVGSIQMTQEIPWDPEKQTHDKIPTEKAVGNLLLKLGLLDENGNLVESANRFRWSDIIGRPNIYETLGENDDGFITQKGITDAIKNLQTSIEGLDSEWVAKINANLEALSNHIANKNNPHDISIDKIGAASAELFNQHISEVNPHGLTAADIHLGHVDDTPDIEKPISLATQAALDDLLALITQVSDTSDGLNYIINTQYDKKSGILKFIFRDGSEITLSVPTDGLVDEITYDSENKALKVYELGGEVKSVDLSELFIRYIGSVETHITITIDGNNKTGNQIIKAAINPKSVTDKEMADDAIITRVLKDQSVTGAKIKDLTITTNNLKDQSVTNEKIAVKTITNTRMADRSINGRTLFTSDVDNRVLAVKDKDTDPVWVQVISKMIADEAIETVNIKKLAVTTDKLADLSVTNAKIDKSAVTTEKIKDLAVTNNKIANKTIKGEKIVDDVTLGGTPTIEKRPDKDDSSNKLPDTSWVNHRIDTWVFSNKNLGDRSVNGRVLFSSTIKDRALVTFDANSDPVWGLINNAMMDIDSVNTDNIKNLAVTADKIADISILTRHISDTAIKENHIDESAVTMEKIKPSDEDQMVLGVYKKGQHPRYTKITDQMLTENSVNGSKLKDGSIAPKKIETNETGYMILGVMTGKTAPGWYKIVNEMIGTSVVDGRTLFSSPFNNTILAVTTAGDDPAWMKITSEMLTQRLIKKEHIEKGAIYQEHLQKEIIDTEHIVPHSITEDLLAPRSVTADILFTSRLPDRVLGVIGDPYSNPVWTKIRGEMLEDESIHKEKLFRSDVPFRVLGVTQAGRPPEYTMVDNRFIVDRSINHAKLKVNFVLEGTPELTIEPFDYADNFQLANTAWVRKTITSMAHDFTTGQLKNSISGDAIIDHSVPLEKLVPSLRGNTVLAVTEDNGTPVYVKVKEAMIENGAISVNKLQRDLMLLGEPTIEMRPGSDSSDENGNGNLIPDCQWVINKIKEAGGFNSSITENPEDKISQYSYDDLVNIWDGFPLPEDYTEYLSERGLGQMSADEVKRLWEEGIYPIESGHDPVNFSPLSEIEVYDMWYQGIIPDTDDDDAPYVPSAQIPAGSVTTSKIQNRSVTAPKLFTTPDDNMVLAVKNGNSDPEYTKINYEMLEDRIIDGFKLFSSPVSNRVLAVVNAESNPAWVRIIHDMIADNAIDNNNIRDGAISGKKLMNESVTREKLDISEPLIDKSLLFDNSVTRSKILDKAVDNYKLADHAVDSKKLDKDLILKGKTVVDDSKDYETRRLRNTILSPKTPENASNGDIWFRYS